MGPLQIDRHRARRRGVPPARQGRLPAGESFELSFLLPLFAAPFFSLSPLLRGEGWDEGPSHRVRLAERAAHPALRADLSPRSAGSGKKKSAPGGNRARFVVRQFRSTPGQSSYLNEILSLAR